MPTSVRYLHEARQAKIFGTGGAAAEPERSEYEVLDPQHNAKLTGLKTYLREGKQYVMLADVEARFYLDMGAIQKVEPAAAP